MAQQTKSNVALCPECEGPVHLRGKLHVGQRLTCRRCGSSLVIVDRRPLELDLANGNHSDMDYPNASRKKDKDAIQFSNKQTSEGKENLQMPTMTKISRADCPECNATLRFHKSLKENQLVVCPDCNETLEVISLHPLELSWANEDPWEYGEYDDPQHLSRHGLS